MEAALAAHNGVVGLTDTSLDNEPMIAMTPAEAMWLSEFLQSHLISEFVVQLKLAALAAQSDTDKQFQLKRS